MQPGQAIDHRTGSDLPDYCCRKQTAGREHDLGGVLCVLPMFYFFQIGIACVLSCQGAASSAFCSSTQAARAAAAASAASSSAACRSLSPDSINSSDCFGCCLLLINSSFLFLVPHRMAVALDLILPAHLVAMCDHSLPRACARETTDWVI